MSRPIAYNASGPLSGSIRGGNVNYTVDSGNRDYTSFASKKWVPSADGAAPIVFVTDTYTQGFEGNPSLAVPLFYSCNGTGSAAIIYTANRLPGSPGNYSDANVALNDLITARGYFILESNDPYQGINADNLAFDVDASKMSSYPQTGTNWRDLSGKGTNGTLTNSPTWNSNGYFAFDGTDDYVNFPNDTALNSDSITVSSTFNPTSVGQNGFLFEKGYVNTQYALFFENPTFKLRFIFNGLGYQDFQINASSYMTAGRWYNAIVTYDGTAKMYINGTNVLTTTYNDTIQVNNNGERIGSWYNGSVTGYHFNGSIANTQVYPRALTEAQVKQNYFGAPIVTDGLVFAVDANNIVSYPKSGTAAYNLIGSGTGTLTNGTSFTPSDGGAFVFDGTDDYIVFPNDTNLDNQALTMESWNYLNTTTTQNAFLFEKGYVNTQYSNFYSNNGNFYFRTMGLSTEDLTFTTSTYVSPNTWNHVVCTYGAGTKTIYINGTQVAQQTGLTGTISTNNYGLYLGAHGPGTNFFLNGKIANSRVYNKALTAAEVLQNYQAEQYRFDYADGSTAALAAPSAAYLYSMGVRTNGLYYINTLSGGPVQVYCDFTTLDANGESGWMLVGSWDNSNTWTLSANSSNSVFGSTPLNCVSSNFGNNPINQFRVQVASTVDSGGVSADADFYYNWDNNTIMWKEVWAPDGTLTYYYLSQGSNPAVTRASIKRFNNSYNIKGSYNNPNHNWNNISDYGYQNTPLPGGIAAVGGTGAPAAGLCPFWTALTTSGNTFGVYCMGRNATFSTCTSADADGTLSIPINGAGTDTTGQDVDSNISAKYGRDDGVNWTTPTDNKMWWWIK